MKENIHAGRPYKRKSDDLWIVPIEKGIGGDGKRKRATVARKTKAAAIKAAQDKVEQLRSGVTGSVTTLTVEGWLRHWSEAILPSRSTPPGTMRGYLGQINRYIVPSIGAYKLVKLTPLQVREMHTYILDKLGLSIGTAQLSHAVLTKALQDAVVEGPLDRNVAAQVKRPSGGSSEEIIALESGQARHALNVAAQHGDPMLLRWSLALLYGVRQGEALGITWPMVDFENDTLDLSWQLTAPGQRHGCGDRSDGTPRCGHARNTPRNCPARELDINPGVSHRPITGTKVLTRPKTKGSRRVVPMIKPIRDLFLLQREIWVPNEWGLVFTSVKRHMPIDGPRDNAAWHEMLKRAGVPDMKLHNARHTAATVLQDLGVDEATRMKIMGHSVAATQRHYAHVSQDQARAALDRFGQELNLALLVGGQEVPAIPSATAPADAVPDLPDDDAIDAEVVELNEAS